MPKVNVIGIGPGNERLMTKEAENAIKNSSSLLGDKRVMAPFEKSGKTVFYSSSIKEITDYLNTFPENEEVSILVSGDVGFYSLAKALTEQSKDNSKINLICGISSLQYFCSKLRVSWDDVVTVSLHGRNNGLIDKVISNHKVFVLTGGKNTPAEICKSLCDYGLGSLEVSVGEDLSYQDERITTALAFRIAEMSFSSLNVMMIFNPNPTAKHIVTHGLPDDLFIRGNVPMTKQEIRAVTISKLQLCAKDIVYDIGAGTGSVSVEIARQLKDGFVYAVEKDPEALELIEKNRQKFSVDNLSVISADAPDGLQNLPKPDKVFIGGSGGNLSGILDILFDKNPDVRIVVNAITLETLNEAVGYCKQKPDLEAEIINMTVSKSKKIGGYNLMTGQNPVYVITIQKQM
ncbi:MAG: precorrin-6y C5,15-methyltransferase (decarboxylating) subunit CbiE [Peptococcaceae bacterium]|nr:precorrin-6y C5,15-methyltransferase (decarboxylating) subunit CbiE [Peptococcaceae bacterium]